MKRKLWPAAACAALVCSCSLEAAALRLYVAPNGDDAAAGDKAHPFATLERARDEIRRLRKTGAARGEVRVILRGGDHFRAAPFELSKEDSGSKEGPVIYQAYPGERARLIGGRVVKGWRPVTDPAVLERFPKAARGKVMQADLKAQGITDFGIVAVRDRRKGDPARRFAFYFNGRPMTLARYPNKGFMKIVDLLGGKPRIVRSTRGDCIGKFTCDSDRLKRWVDEPEPWVHGYWYWDWSDQRHKVKLLDPKRRYIEVEPPYHHYGYRKGHWFYAFNLLSEIDEPGEWYLDRRTGVLYFYPPSPLDRGEAVVALSNGLLRLSGASHVTFLRLDLEYARGTAVMMRQCADCRLAACRIHAIGGYAVGISGGERCGVVGCDIFNMDGGGVTLLGGDRRTLKPSRHYAVNNHIYHYGLWNRMYQKAVSLSGVGQRAAHNLIHDAPHQAINFGGNDHLIEFNEIHSVCYESNDAGAIYAGRDWTARGAVIRCNYMHHVFGFQSRGCVGVYLDDMYCGTRIESNVFYKVTRAAFIGGGRDNVVENNIFVDCPRALHIDARALGWAHACADRWIQEARTKGTLRGIRYKEPPYSTRWPALARILEGRPKAPEGNLIQRNIFYGGTWRDIQRAAEKYITLRDNLINVDPHFVDYAHQNFQLRDDSPAYKKIGFKRIPFEKIGLYQDALRASWPVENKVLPAPKPPAWKRKRRKGPRPVCRAARVRKPPVIDGRLARGEWPGKPLRLAVDVYGRPARRVSRAWVARDNAFLYVAVLNDVNPKQPLKREAKWGANDAVELAFRNPALGKTAPILILRGYPNGRHEGSTEAGAPADATDTLAASARYAASIPDAGHWIAEWSVPLSSLGVAPGKPAKLQFNISVRKTADSLWLMWVATHACTWEVGQAGSLALP